MQTVPDKSQRPQQGASGPCAKCRGSGRVTMTKGGKPARVPCIACRGTGQSQRGYQTK